MKEQNEKQAIEEMARKMCRNFAPNGNCSADGDPCYLECIYGSCAERIYAAGYRKQSEGEWIDQYNGKYANPIYVCSVCGKGTLLTPYINELNNMAMIQALSPFCPNCGAKMKGKEK